MRRLVSKYRDTSYVVYSTGEVYNNGKEVGYENNGYILVRIGKNGYTIKRNRMVAECFKYFEEIPQELDVHHKDGNKTNDSISNLEILTKKQHQHLHKHYENFKKKIIMDNSMVFDSITECERYLGINKSHIGHAIEGKGKHKTVKCHTFSWYYE